MHAATKRTATRSKPVGSRADGSLPLTCRNPLKAAGLRRSNVRPRQLCVGAAKPAPATGYDGSALGMPFNTLRAAFWLLALITVAQVVATLAGSATCYWLFVIGKAEIGQCQGFAQLAREIWSEALAAILALLLAARGEPPPPRD
jgi:hypothetical protein